GQGNLTVCARYGVGQQHRLLYCRACKYRFSEHKATPLFNSRLPRDKLLAALRHLADGCGIRQTARLVGVDKDTVGRLAPAAGWPGRLAPRPGSAPRSWRLFPPETKRVQREAKWSFGGGKQNPCAPHDPRDCFRGAKWDHVAFAPDSRLVRGVVVGRRLDTTAE